MPERAEIVNVKIRRELDGYFVVTSNELPGLVLAHMDIRELLADVPAAIMALYMANLGISVRVIEAFPASSGKIELPPAWMVMRQSASTLVQ